MYNDPINLVDPGGNVPALPIRLQSLPTSEELGAAFATPFKLGLGFFDWWYSKPDNCDCQGQGGQQAFWGPLIGVGAQGINGIVTTPAEAYGEMVVEQLVTRQVQRSVSLQWLRNSRWMRRMILTRALIPNRINLGKKTIQEWRITGREMGTLDELTAKGRLAPRANGTHQLNDTTRVTIDTKPRPRGGLGGFAGAAAWAAWIDDLVQLYVDSDLCLSPMQKANRFAVALTLGLAGGTAAGLAFTAGIAGVVGLAGLGIILSPLAAVLVPVLAGVAVGYGFTAYIGTPLKEAWFEQKPGWFGTVK